MDKIFSVKFSRVKNNILNALTFLYKKNFDKPDMSESYQKERINAWKDKLKSGYNQRLINDGFWLIVLKKNRGKFFPHEYAKSSKNTQRTTGTTRRSQSKMTNTMRSTNPFRVSNYSRPMRRNKGSRYSNSRSKQKSSVRSRKFKKTFDGKYDEEQFFDDKELEEIYNNIENSILDRMAENYIEFMIGCDGKEKDLFF
jgi:dTDP-4-dehydrorhamnose reductase